MSANSKIVITGGAGLVGQNLIPQLKDRGFSDLVILDKHKKNLEILRSLHPDISIYEADLSESGSWQDLFKDCFAVVQLHAQIGGLVEREFRLNNIVATQNVLEAMRRYSVDRLIHVSSSVVESSADDWYTNTKKSQEEIVLNSNFSAIVFRPTLMFGWFDRKHLGWLSRFMEKSPIFPIPGDGKVIRQPLFAGDFATIIVRSIESPELQGVFNISGTEKITYIDIIRTIKEKIRAKTLIIKLPATLFRALLYAWSIFDRTPPFTVQQLDALLANEEFDTFDWPSFFSVEPTSFENAIEKTFCHPIYSHITLEF